ncbi:phospholipase A-2-activating protein [Agrilus planipennis]|uniref:Phospholipase A-2-activating protein n=1 Tax=Agrilus planipennis TaxID=224129 RepID=A0A1W4XKI1_AGRPL|nr:phospholipase A-2-activating protein [Agrilus planipennis]
MAKPFKLSAILFGHSLDVRSIAVTPENSIISGSRDKTAKLWNPNGINPGYTEALTYRDHKNFVASVLYLEPNELFPTGTVITGGNDSAILIYKIHEPFASVKLEEHKNTVCYLSKGCEKNTFLSSSWDNTAKLWSINNLPNSLVTFTGHTAAVWAVIQLPNTNIVTASADKNITIFSKDGHRIQILHGHTDCVRNLVDLPDLQFFVSVANDATIRVWSYNGKNLQTYYGHTNYIYGIARNEADGPNAIVTSDEDRTIRYWKDGENIQTFQLPAQSVWCVECLSNGDIVTGSSDGVVRVFTQHESRYASEETLKAFEEEVNALSKQATQEIGGYKVSDLPGCEALYEPGKHAGQMKMIREVNGVVAYTWVDEGENSHWEKVGEVLGGVDKANEGKTLHEGKYYDFVFSVDVEDGKPPLKLPYNKGEDPYVTAHAFLQKNMLPADYLEQVVNFILQNSQSASNNIPVNSEYIDPFTGASRYTPSGGKPSNASSIPTNNGANLDPFTGANSYNTGSTNQISVPKTNLFPQTTYRLFEMGDPNLILAKLKEFNGKLSEGQGKLDESVFEGIIKMCNGPFIDPKYLELLFELLNWNDEIIFPVIDVIRLAVRNETNNKYICTSHGGIIIEKLKRFISPECKIANNTLVSFRALCNFFAHSFGENLIFHNRTEILENITGLNVGNKNSQIALATLLLNLTVLCLKKSDEFGILILANVLPDMINLLDDNEAQFRAYVALGTMLSSGSSEQANAVRQKVLEDDKFMERLNDHASQYSNEIELKRKNCASQVQNKLLG